MDCPPEDGIAAFAEGRLQGPDAERIELHLDACRDCAQLVSDFARVFSDRGVADSAPGSGTITRPGASLDADPRDEDVPVLRAGDLVGRYRVLECVGIGGMGVVYGAYDPELDRRIALKVLRGKATRDRRRNARLLREAQAMARLTHPNVITVYDVGTYARGVPDDASELLVYVAMEFVRGQTLARWAAAQRRDWPALREVCVAAGRGLAAAHAAGLVHRDFKPDNVLVGDDGRVRVTDFGLARIGPTTETGERDSSGPIASQLLSQAPSTETGAVLGTPAYMAPEQYSGIDVSPASDQFSFCVTVFEAAYGVRPFAGRTFAELVTNIEAGTIREPPAQRELPRRVHAAIVRGLCADPERRFRDMNALLDELTADRGRALRRALLVAASTAAVAIAWAAAPRSGAHAIAFCRDDAALVAEWRREQRDRVHAALSTTEVVYARATADTVIDRLDAWVDRWSGQQREVCERPGAIAGDPDLATMLGVQCLRRARAGFFTTLDVLGSADADTVTNAIATIESLAAPEQCAEAERGDPPPEPPPEQAERVAAVRERIGRVETLLWAARFDDADAELLAARTEADAIGFAPLSAEVLLFEGRARMSRGEPGPGVAMLEEAAWSAVEARDRRVAARAFTALAYGHGVHRSEIEPARRAVRAARAELRAAGGDPWLEANLLLNEGAAELTASNFEAARTAFRTALASGVFEHRPMSRADLLMNLAAVASELHEFDDAIATIEHARGVYEEEVGPQHPAVASAMFNLGATYFRKGDYDLAVEYVSRASALELVSLGAQHPTHANTLGSLGIALSASGRFAEAVAPLREAVAILEARGEADDATLSLQRINLASALFETGRLDEAAPIAKRGHDDLLARLGPEHHQVATASSLMASIRRKQGDLEAAETLSRRALEIMQHVFGATHGDIVYAQVDLADVLAERGRVDEALQLLDEILALHPDPSAAPEELAFARFLAARERWMRRDDPPRARAEIAAARAKLRTFPGSSRAAEVEAWLHTHPNAAP